MYSLYCCCWVFCVSGSFGSFVNNIYKKKSITEESTRIFFFLHFSTDRNFIGGTYRGKCMLSLSPSMSVTDDQKSVGNAVGVCYRWDAFVGNKINNRNKKAVGKSVGNHTYRRRAVCSCCYWRKASKGSVFVSISSITGSY